MDALPERALMVLALLDTMEVTVLALLDTMVALMVRVRVTVTMWLGVVILTLCGTQKKLALKEIRPAKEEGSPMRPGRDLHGLTLSPGMRER